jgi:hypothetical protein
MGQRLLVFRDSTGIARVRPAVKEVKLNRGSPRQDRLIATPARHAIGLF